MMPIRVRTITLLLIACAAVPAAAAPPLPYQVTLVTGPPGVAYSVADINNRGQRAGDFSPPQGRGHAFFQTGSGLVDLGTLGGWTSSARDLNNVGEVAGNADAGISGSTRAFLYSNGRMRSLGTLGGDFSYATAMNDAGQVVGYSHTLDDREHGFLYSNDTMIDLGTLAARNIYSFASDINASGQVTGHWVDDQGYQRGFIYENGTMKDIGTLGGRWSMATAINDVGDIVGIAETMFFGIHGFLRRNGQMIDLGSLGGGGSGAYDINNLGEVIGSSFGGPSGPFLWRNGEMYDVNQYLMPGSGYNIESLGRINDLGQILATGCTAAGCVQVLLAPVPEPATAAMLALGLGIIGFIALRPNGKSLTGRLRFQNMAPVC